MYGDECSRSRDIDALERKTDDLDYEIGNVKRDLDYDISDVRSDVKEAAAEARDGDAEIRERIDGLRADLDRAFGRIEELERRANDTESRDTRVSEPE